MIKIKRLHDPEDENLYFIKLKLDKLVYQKKLKEFTLKPNYVYLKTRSNKVYKVSYKYVIENL